MKHVTTAVLFGVLSALAHAQQQSLSASELRAVLIGRTVESTVHDRNLRVRNYYAPDGVVYGFNVDRGTKFQGQWSITDAGQLCTWFQVQGHLCTALVRMEDGSFQRIDGSSVIATFHRILDGNMAK